MRNIRTTLLLLFVFVAIAATAGAQSKKDPFESPLQHKIASSTLGYAHWNLQSVLLGNLRIDGIVKFSGQLVAVATHVSGRTYFLREGDLLYDGAVDKISMDGVTFHEEGKDAFGKPIERQVNKRIYSIAGEQQ